MNFKYRKIIKKLNKLERISLDDAIQRYNQIKKGNMQEYDMSDILYTIETLIVNILDMKPYKEQYYCALGLYEGYVTEFATGEGKTLACLIAALLCNLRNNKVHIVTVNDYLSKRDYEFAKPLYEALNVSSGYNEKGSEELYLNEVIYTSSHNIVFDYLKGFQIPFETVIIDEIDYSIVECANSNFSISTQYKYVPSTDEYVLARELLNCFEGKELQKCKDLQVESLFSEITCDYVYSKYNQDVYFTYRGIEKLNSIFKDSNFLENNSAFYATLITTLKVELFHVNGIDYMIIDGEVSIINQYNGRVFYHSSYQADVQTAIEVKEGVKVTTKTLLNNSVSYQIFFSKYENLVGLSGTVKDAQDDFREIFCKDVLIIKERIKSKRVDLKDKVFLTKAEKYSCLVDIIKENNMQSILIIAEDEKASYEVEKSLSLYGINSKILNNSVDSDSEGELVKQAGQPGILISTNMIGRGTDIKSEDLFIIVLQHYFSKRIDRQIKGRTARQGNKGKCVFLVSLEDSLFRFLSVEKKNQLEIELKNNKLNYSNFIKMIETLQDNIEGHYFEGRKISFERDFMIENQKDILSYFKDSISKDNMIDNAVKVLSDQSEFINENRLINKPKDYDLLIKKSLIKKNMLNNTIGNKLFSAIFDYYFEKHWLFYLKHLKSEYTIILNMYGRKDCIVEFQKKCSEMQRYFKCIVLLDALKYFIYAEISQDRIAEKKG